MTYTFQIARELGARLRWQDTQDNNNSKSSCFVCALFFASAVGEVVDDEAAGAHVARCLSPGVPPSQCLVCSVPFDEWVSLDEQLELVRCWLNNMHAHK